MHSIVAPLSALLFVLGGLAVCVGMTHTGKRLVLAGAGVAFLGPLVGPAADAVLHFAGVVWPTFHVGFFVAVIILVIVGTGGVRFINHRRALRRWFSATPPSLPKRRIDE